MAELQSPRGYSDLVKKRVAGTQHARSAPMIPVVRIVYTSAVWTGR